MNSSYFAIDFKILSIFHAVFHIQIATDINVSETWNDIPTSGEYDFAFDKKNAADEINICAMANENMSFFARIEYFLDGLKSKPKTV